MAREQVAELCDLDRDDTLTRDEKLVPRLERLRRHAIRVDVRAAHRLDPAGLDHGDAAPTVPVEPAVDVLLRRVLLRVEAGTRAVPREPVEPPVPRIDGPDKRLVERMQLVVMRVEDLDGRVLAHVPELAHGRLRNSAAGSGQKRSSAASSRRSHPYSTCSSLSCGSQPGSTSTRNASTCTRSPGSSSTAPPPTPTCPADSGSPPPGPAPPAAPRGRPPGSASPARPP